VRTLYICYLGLDEPLVQSQVLPYLRQLVTAGVDVNLLTFEKELWQRPPGELAERQQKLASQAITWSHLRYHKRPSLPATLYDIVAGAIRTIQLMRNHDIDVLHARAHIPIAMALIAQKVRRCAVIFDLRGLIAEEYADAGIWKENSVPFKAIKWLERNGLRRASQIVVLTSRARNWLVEMDPGLKDKISVIPTCVDLSRFPTDINHRDDRFEVVYAGSVYGLYLLEEMARFFVELKRLQPKAVFRILTLAPRTTVARILERVGLSESDFEVAAVDPVDVPRNLQRARLGISFRKPTFSQIAASPTKIAEYLAAGIPVVSNTGTGDIDELFRQQRVGITVDSFDRASLQEAAAQALDLVAEDEIKVRCRQTAQRYFDLAEIGGKRYQEVYERINRAARASSKSTL